MDGFSGIWRNTPDLREPMEPILSLIPGASDADLMAALERTFQNLLPLAGKEGEDSAQLLRHMHQDLQNLVSGGQRNNSAYDNSPPSVRLRSEFPLPRKLDSSQTPPHQPIEIRLKEFLAIYPQPAAVFTISTEWTDVSPFLVNQPLLHLFGYSLEEVYRMKPMDFIHEEDKLPFLRALKEIKEHGSANWRDLRLKKKDGTVLWCDLHVGLGTFDGRRLGIALLSDQTDRRETEKHLLNLQKMEAMELFIGGLAHDINNALQILLFHTESSREALQQFWRLMAVIGEKEETERFLRGMIAQVALTPHFQKLLDELLASFGREDGNEKERWDDLRPAVGMMRILRGIVEQLQEGEGALARIRGLINDLRHLSSPQGPGEAFKLNDILTERGIRAVAGVGIQLSMRIPAEPLMVSGPEKGIWQAVTNIVANARDAMEKQSTKELRIEAVKRVLDQKSLNECYPAWPMTSVKPGPFVCLTIQDTGKGMDEATQSRIFDPYFSTKRDVSGPSLAENVGHSGLGLAMTRKIVQDAGGFIALSSAPGKGALFSVYLPDLSVPAPVISLRSRAVAPIKSTLLLVDDEAILLRALKRGLISLGYTDILSASDGAEALEVYLSNPHVSAAILDFHMPGNLTGLDLMKKLREKNPDLPVILLSGAAVYLDQSPEPSAETKFLSKPIEIRELGEALQGLLRKGSGR